MVETSDHVFPRALLKAMPAQTETWSRRNKVRACSGCNTAKGDMHPLDWLPRVRGPGVDRLRNKLVVLGISPARIRLALGQSPIPYLRDEYAAGGLGPGRDDTGQKQALPANY